MVAAVRTAPALAGKQQRGSLAMLSVPFPSPAAVGDDLLLSDAETTASSTTTAAPNSSLSSASSLPRCSSLSRLSFDCSPSAALAAAASCSPPPAPAPALSSSRPHRAGDAAWAAIRAASTSAAGAQLGPRDFKLLRRVGGGDIGTVYLCRLRSSCSSSTPAPAAREGLRHHHHLYAMKVVDRRVVARKKKLERAAAEKRILRKLDHPFLPTLFADFDAPPHFSCVVTEFCPGGDLHSLRHRMPARRFPLPSARLKRRRRTAPKTTTTTFVAEPVDARSSSFVGTHEYVAPEVARGDAHGAAVDWWAYGVFLYELLYGRTPFGGDNNQATLRNIARRPLAFPSDSGDDAAAAARDLIARLLVKDPRDRLGSRRGAADVKGHAFFRGLNFALLRSSRPPVVPGVSPSPLHRSQSCHVAPATKTTTAVMSHKKKKQVVDARFDFF
ncbi:hypothetical protein HU200_008765 [Digitaria exilis]|uniref:non-specific serine/threonine protein kinase n=1 Tax=Digitaria exilis TaxID=1010633 RepID=A0A835FMX6_9POAL|nr:hypothetical protein HU200_008765 [Digitaria exilis]